MHVRPACPGRVYWASGALPVPIVLWGPGAALGRTTGPKLKKPPKSDILDEISIKKINTRAAREGTVIALLPNLMSLIHPYSQNWSGRYYPHIYFIYKKPRRRACGAAAGVKNHQK